MQKYVSVRSTAEKVLPLEIDEYHVTLNQGIHEIHKEPSSEDAGDGFNGWEIDEQIIYEKDEYIALISQEKDELTDTVTSILTEVIPSLMGE